METELDLRRRSFWARVELVTSGCWEWRGGTRKNGYGSFAIRKLDGVWTQTTSHRWAFVDQGGVIPDGYEVDHLCRNRPCVRPDHLEAVTLQENRRRRDTGYAPSVDRSPRPVPAFGPLPPLHGPERRKNRSKSLRKKHSDPPAWCVNGHEYAKVGWRSNGRNRLCGGCQDARTAAKRKGGAHGTETHCPRQHEYSKDNTRVRIRNGTTSRECKKCVRDRNRAAARRRAELRRAAA